MMCTSPNAFSVSVGLVTSMPAFVLIENKYHGVDFSREHDLDRAYIKCVLFDLQALWYERLPLESLVNRENERNPIVTYNEALINSTLLSIEAVAYTIEETETKKLTVKYYVSATPITFVFQLTAATTEQLSLQLIVPLWRTVLLLDSQKRNLKAILEKKDAELEQYRLEGAVLKRTTMQTSKFNGEEFETSYMNEDERTITREDRTILQLLTRLTHRHHLKQAVHFVDRTTVASSVVQSPGGQSSSGSPNKRKKRKRRAIPGIHPIKFPELADQK
ncbi:non-homologous end-joining factor 1-like isoform X2 [Anopheles aquasalis]|uniref:non-homologous end-joining factor 1-like isoform X2 n=1 Tax=Anopheles aquasalis TaxID=42839 RepID=UPI00215AAE0F|nr:non-homologous end-joining factor 1-like isoform X2 [Anopheles aquasalis]